MSYSGLQYFYYFFSYTFTKAQKQELIDSLTQAIKADTQPDTNKVILLNELAWELHIQQSDKALTLC